MSTSGNLATGPEEISRETSLDNRTNYFGTGILEIEDISSDESESSEETEPESESDPEPSSESDPEEEQLARELAELTIEETAMTEVAQVKDMNPKGVIDPGFFEGDRNKFTDGWRGMKLYLKFHKHTEADERIIVILTRMRGGTAGYFAEMWTDKISNDSDTADWDVFEKELTTMFSIGNAKEIAENKIEGFKQGN